MAKAKEQGDTPPTELKPKIDREAVIARIIELCTPRIFAGNLFGALKKEFGIDFGDPLGDELVSEAVFREKIESSFSGDDHCYQLRQDAAPAIEVAAEPGDGDDARRHFELSTQPLEKSFAIMADHFGKLTLGFLNYQEKTLGMVTKWDAIASELLPGLLAAQSAEAEGGGDQDGGGESDALLEPIEAIVERINDAVFPESWPLADMTYFVEIEARFKNELMPLRCYGLAKRLTPHDDQMYYSTRVYCAAKEEFLPGDFATSGDYKVKMVRYVMIEATFPMIATVFSLFPTPPADGVEQ